MRTTTHSIALILPALTLAVVSGCGLGSRASRADLAAEFELPPPAITADSSRASLIAPGVVHRFYWMREGPWAVHLLDIDREACWTLSAAKPGRQAIGRARTSEIVSASGSNARRVVGGVNADFFLFSPPGLPVGVHVEDGRVVAGPIARPVVLVDSSGAVRTDSLRVTGWLAAPEFGAEVNAWNRPRADGLALFDARWGAATDSATGALEVVLASGPRQTVMAIDTLAAGVSIPPGGAVLALGRNAPAVLRMQLSRLRPGADTVQVALALAPTHPRDAVGGFPILLRRGAEPANLDSAGGARFGPVRHPRTAVGVGASGRRLLLVVVDGRQPSYSAGMTLRELATLMRAFGAHDALNLDGGGSSTMAIAERPGRGRSPARVVNRPSDASGERPVANALVVERRC